MTATKTTRVQRQLDRIAELGQLRPAEFSPEFLAELCDLAARPANDEVQVRAAILLSNLYPEFAPRDEAFARRVHTILLRDLREPRSVMAHPSCNWLVMTHLRAENLQHIPWRTADEVAAAAECFYGYCPSGADADDSHLRIRDLVKYAGRHFARNHHWEEAFRLFEQVHVPASVMDADLFWLRNTLVLYERRRVRRVRNVLYLTLILAAGVILGVVPLVFELAENPARILEGAAEITWFDSLYWSCITAATVGYGDITPVTTAGKILALVNALLGVLVTGVIAGLIMGRVAPRSLP